LRRVCWPTLEECYVCFIVSSTTLFPILSKLTLSILSFQDLTDNSSIRLTSKKI
jgi:hypothetical protein